MVEGGGCEERQVGPFLLLSISVCPWPVWGVGSLTSDMGGALKKLKTIFRPSWLKAPGSLEEEGAEGEV